MSSSSAMNWICSKVRPRSRAASLVPILCAASRCNSSSLASESERFFPRSSWRSKRLAVARAAGVGKRWRMARAVGRLGSFKIRVNSGKTSSQTEVNLFLRRVLSVVSSYRCCTIPRSWEAASVGGTRRSSGKMIYADTCVGFPVSFPTTTAAILLLGTESVK